MLTQERPALPPPAVSAVARHRRCQIGTSAYAQERTSLFDDVATQSCRGLLIVRGEGVSFKRSWPYFGNDNTVIPASNIGIDFGGYFPRRVRTDSCAIEPVTRNYLPNPCRLLGHRISCHRNHIDYDKLAWIQFVRLELHFHGSKLGLSGTRYAKRQPRDIVRTKRLLISDGKDRGTPDNASHACCDKGEGPTVIATGRTAANSN